MANLHNKIFRIFIISLCLFGIFHSSNAQESNNATLVGEWTGGDSYSVYVANDIAYFSKDGYLETSPHYLEIVDISDPSNPTELGNVASPSFIKDIFVNGDYAYLAAGSSGLRIVDVSDPMHPYEIGFYDTDGSASGIIAKGDFAFLADGTAGLRVINIADPSNPYEIGFFVTNGPANGIDLSGDHVFIAGNYSGLTIINISNPTNPTKLSYIDRGSYNVIVSGNFAYMAGGSGMLTIDVSDLSNPIVIASYYAHWEVKDIALSGDFVYLANEYYGLRIIDVSIPDKPKEIGYEGSNTIYYNGVVVHGDYAYIATSDPPGGGRGSFGGLIIVDISDPANPSTSAFFSTNAFIRSVAIYGDYAYAVDYNNGLRILNISNPEKVIQAGYFHMRRIEKVAIDGNYAYVLSHNLYILDISDPSKPTLVGTFEHHDIAKDVSINGKFAYVVYSRTGDERQGLRVLDISDPTNTVQLGSFVTSDYYHIDSKGNYAYALKPGNGLHVFDISDASNPLDIGQVIIEGETKDIKVVGDFAYVANRNNGLRIINISDPTNPIEIGFYITDDIALGVSVSGEYAYVAVGFGGLDVIDISDPFNPVKAGFLDIDGASYYFSAADVASNGNHAYLAYGGYGFCVIKNDLLADEETKLDILSFSFGLPPQTKNTSINPYGHTINIEVKYGTVVTDLVSTYTLSDGATAIVGGVGQESGVTQNDFTNPITYQITAPNGLTTQKWIVTVTIATNDETDILSYAIDGLSQIGEVIVDPVTHNIKITVSSGIDLTKLVAMFELSDGAKASIGEINQQSGETENDFTNEVTYTITAEDGETVQDWVFVIDIITALEDDGSSFLKEFSLSQNYKNPFDFTTTIDFGVSETANVNIVILNLLGQEVKTLVEKKYEPGKYHVTWDGLNDQNNNVSPGIYLIRMKAGKFTQERKMLLKR